MQSFLNTTSSQLQQKLPLSNELLRQLGCLNPQKRSQKSTVASIQSITSLLQPKVSAVEVVDEWKVFQVDSDLPVYNPKERTGQFWNKVFKLQAADGDIRYKFLPTVVKSALVLAQTNADSEGSLSVNARIIGLHIVKEAVRFFDPASSQPEKIPVTQDLKKSVRAAHSAYRERLEQENEEKKKEEARKRKEMSEMAQKEKDRLLEQKKILAKSEEDLSEQEAQARQELEAADELLNDARLKLSKALACTHLNKNSATVAQMMLETAEKKRKEAMGNLDNIKKQKSLDKTTHKLNGSKEEKR